MFCVKLKVRVKLLLGLGLALCKGQGYGEAYCLKFNKRSIVSGLKCTFWGLCKILITNMLVQYNLQFNLYDQLLSLMIQLKMLPPLYKSDSIFSSTFVKSVCGNVCRNNSKLCHYFGIIVLHANNFSQYYIGLQWSGVVLSTLLIFIVTS